MKNTDKKIAKIYSKICAIDSSTEKGMNKISDGIYEILGLQAKNNPNVLNNTITTEKFPYVGKGKNVQSSSKK